MSTVELTFESLFEAHTKVVLSHVNVPRKVKRSYVSPFPLVDVNITGRQRNSSQSSGAQTSGQNWGVFKPPAYAKQLSFQIAFLPASTPT